MCKNKKHGKIKSNVLSRTFAMVPKPMIRSKKKGRIPVTNDTLGNVILAGYCNCGKHNSGLLSNFFVLKQLYDIASGELHPAR